MYVRMVWGLLRLGKWTEYERHFNDRVANPDYNIQGLCGRQLLRSIQDPDEGISLSIWESMESMLSYEKGELRQELAEEVEHLYQGEYWVKHFEVRSAKGEQGKDLAGETTRNQPAA